MKKKFILLNIFIIVIVVGVIVYLRPVNIINIEPNDVSSISIFDGGSGKSIDITNSTDIKHIIENLNSIKFKKGKLSLGIKGYSYRVTIYKENKKIYKEFIINSNNTIRKDPFFYRDDTNSIDYDYIYNLIN